MKQFFEKNALFRFLRSNGVYVALAVSLLAVGGVVTASFGQSLLSPPVEEGSAGERVEQTVTGQKDTRTTTTTTRSETSVTTTTTETHENAPELYVFPLSNTVQKTFSIDTPVYSDTMKDWRLHTGVDFAGKEGQKVKSMARGTVVSITEESLWGKVITIDHGVGVESIYYGVAPTVKEGDEVDAGTQIGTLTEIPCESAQKPHLHLEIRVDGKWVDPLSVITLEVRYGESME